MKNKLGNSGVIMFHSGSGPGISQYASQHLNKTPQLVTVQAMSSIPTEEEQNLTLKFLKELCEYPILYVNIRVVASENPCADKHFAVTVSNKEPETNNETLEAKYPIDAIAADIFFSYEINSFVTNLSLHWAKLICSILTFRGHEVFFNNKIFVPFENEL